jgi:signal transduction histidine kinase
MKKKEHFSSAIELKFILLRLFIAAVIIVLSIVCVFLLQKTADDSAAVIRTGLPQIHATQEIYSAVLTSSLYASALLSVQDIHSQHDEGDEKRYQTEFQNNVNRAILFLDAISLGTESQEFRSLNGGETWRRWQALGLEERLIVEAPSSELIAIADDLRNSINRFEQTINEAIEAHGSYAEIELSATEENTDVIQAHTQALKLEEVALTELVGPVTTSLNNMENLLEMQVRRGVDEVNESNNTKQILVSLAALLAAFISLFVGMLFSSRIIVKPLEELTKTAEEMAAGKLSRRVKIHSRDEIGKLGYTFNKMANRLEASYDDLEKIVKEKTDALSSVLDKFEHKNEDLERSQMATINLLEDLEEEKRAVEQRVKDRTIELEQEKNKLLQVTSNMRGGGILLDKEYNVVFTNDSTYQLLGIDPKTPNDDLIEKFFQHFDTDVIRTYYRECIEGKTFHVSEIDGHGRVYEIFFHHLKGASGTVNETTGYFILFVDISDAKLLERSKSELVAVASHQLRTPLTAMRGNVEMLIDESFGELNKEQHELLDDIDVSTIRLITMVNEMLDITKIEKGDLEMSLEKLNVKEIIDSVVADLSGYAQRHQFEIDSSGLSDVTIEGDRMRVRQVFQNLIDNSIKYSRHPGKLKMSSKEENGKVELTFADNGIGIPKIEQPKLFERFYRASNTAKTASSGSGLGLYIVKSIIEQLGGEIKVQSEEEVGTTFFVTLPAVK